MSFKTYDDAGGVHIDLGSEADGPLALSQRAAEAVLGVMMADPALLLSEVIVHRHSGPSKVRDAASLAGVNRRHRHFWSSDNEPESQLQREQAAALAGNAAPGTEVWDGDPMTPGFDPAEYGVETTADGKFRVRRRRRDRRAAAKDAGVLAWGSDTESQIGGLRRLNDLYRRHWSTRR